MASTIQFSQASLQDYADCPRRYQLRYVLMLPWPARVTGQPLGTELQLQRGAEFHRLIHQLSVGLSPSQLAPLLERDPVLMRWWQTYLQHPPSGLPSTYQRSEVALAAPIAGHRLFARLDLLATEPGVRAVIVDWKTSLRKLAHLHLASRLQTRVYRYLLVVSVSSLDQQTELKPEQVEMAYWYCEFDGATERFAYDSDQFAADHAYLTTTIQAITSHHEEIWPLTDDEALCGGCSYQSLCERRVSTGFLTDPDAEHGAEPPEIDLEQIAEVAF